MGSYGFRLYARPEVPSLVLDGSGDWDGYDSPSDRFIAAWLERFEGFDYGALTVWLMRGFGLPNLRAYETFKHSFCWGLETPEGYVIEVEPGLRRVPAHEYRAASKVRKGERDWSQQDWVRFLTSGNVFRLHPLRADAPPVTDALIQTWLDQFSRPIYVRDVGADVMGALREQGKPDVGPGDDSVLSGGAELADCPTPPGVAGRRPD